jgi:flagellar secretion chaperone FliS
VLQNAAQMYQTSSISTATPAELTLMLYNGAVKFVKQAKSAISDKNFGKAHDNIIRAQNILDELIATLNRNYPISEQFLLMYEYMLRRLFEANVRKDVTILDEVEGYFVEFRDTWKEAMVLAKKQETK